MVILTYLNGLRNKIDNTTAQQAIAQALFDDLPNGTDNAPIRNIHSQIHTLIAWLVDKEYWLQRRFE